MDGQIKLSRRKKLTPKRHWLLNGNYNMVEQRFIKKTNKMISDGDKCALRYRINDTMGKAIHIGVIDLPAEKKKKY